MKLTDAVLLECTLQRDCLKDISPVDLRSMSAPPNSTPEQLSARITQLEELLTHLQQTTQDLSEVVIQQHRRSDQIEQELARLTECLQAISESKAADTDITDELPPHY